MFKVEKRFVNIAMIVFHKNDFDKQDYNKKRIVYILQYKVYRKNYKSINYNKLRYI